MQDSGQNKGSVPYCLGLAPASTTGCVMLDSSFPCLSFFICRVEDGNGTCLLGAGGVLVGRMCKAPGKELGKKDVHTVWLQSRQCGTLVSLEHS